LSWPDLYAGLVLQAVEEGADAGFIDNANDAGDFSCAAVGDESALFLRLEGAGGIALDFCAVANAA